MNVWVPTKGEIESILLDLYNKLKAAKTVTEVAYELNCKLCEMECHIANRAQKEIK